MARSLDPMRDPPPLPGSVPGAPRPRHALLVNPFYPKDPAGSFGKHVLTPSLALSSLAAATPEGWSVRLWDENLLQGPVPVEPVPEVVGITVHLTFARRSYQLADHFRAQGCKVVMGGPHALSCPEEVAAHCDVVAIGNGVPLWPQILRDAERGRLQPLYRAAFEDFGAEPHPDHAFPPARDFLTRASVIATRGCHNRCDFCFLATGDTRIRYQMRPVEDVAREIAGTGEPYAVFLDNNLGASRPYLRSLCRALAPLRIVWSAAVSLDVSDDPALVREMALSGCTGVFVGLESLNDANLRAAGKRTPRADDYARRVELFHRHGIQVNGSFVFGFDGDGPEVFARTAEWIEQVRLECATFHILTPYPGTPLFARLEAAGRILHRDWDLYDTAHAVFRPLLMTPGQLEEGYRWIYRRVFSARSIWARRPPQASAVVPYLAMAWLYKRCNRMWKLLVQHRLTHALWRPLVRLTQLRHLRYRRRLLRKVAGWSAAAALPVPPGV
jgi:radical SAM superfamily enzyme YgiQ (UPF0313 family)